MLEAFRNPVGQSHGDGAVIDPHSGQRMAFCTDSFVVSCAFGWIDKTLAVHSTLNDLAMVGAVPSGIVLPSSSKRAFPSPRLRGIADMAFAAADAASRSSPGTWSGAKGAAKRPVHHHRRSPSWYRRPRDLTTQSAPSDRVLISAPSWGSGMAVAGRGDLAIEADGTDRACQGLMGGAVGGAPSVTRWLRGPTRGKLGTSAIRIQPRQPTWRSAGEEAAGSVRKITAPVRCGIDPLTSPTRSKFLCRARAGTIDAALAARREPSGGDAGGNSAIADEQSPLFANRELRTQSSVTVVCSSMTPYPESAEESSTCASVTRENLSDHRCGQLSGESRSQRRLVG